MSKPIMSMSIEWPQEDVNKLLNAISAAIKYLDKDLGGAIKMAVRHIISALGTSTRVAPKYREFREIPSKSKRRDVKTYEIEGWWGTPRQKRSMTVNAKNITSVKKYHAAIYMRGLAKMSWKWAAALMHEYLSSLTVASMNMAQMMQTANKYVDAAYKFNGDDPFAMLTNRIPYIKDAIIGGENSVDTAMSRAADGMMKSLENQLVKRMGLGSLSR